MPKSAPSKAKAKPKVKAKPKIKAKAKAKPKVKAKVKAKVKPPSARTARAAAPSVALPFEVWRPSHPLHPNYPPRPALSARKVRALAASARRKLRIKNAKTAIIFAPGELEALLPPLRPDQESAYDAYMSTGIPALYREAEEYCARKGLPPPQYGVPREERN